MLNRSKTSEKQRSSSFIGNMNKTRDKITVMSFDEAISQCQAYINKNATHNYRKIEDIKQKRIMTDRYICEYVEVEKPDVEEFKELLDLKQALIEEITQYGPITDAMENDTIEEIRANGPKQIFIERLGVTELLDKNFVDKEHMEKIITKLIRASKQRLTPKTPLVNARTIEGARVNATHSCISPYGNPSFVIRKFKKNTVTPGELVRGGGISQNMLKLLCMIPKAGLSWITVGPTGSGKTTLNEMLVKQIDPLCRIITIENPSELRLLRYKNGDVHQGVENDVLQYESVSEELEDDNMATMENLLINSMRQSPRWIGPGELRYPREFTTALRAAQTGHNFFTTLHSEGDIEAIYRFLTAYLSASNEPAELALRNICSSVKFIIFQERLADGTRKVTSITEVKGSEGLNPIIEQIYRFVCLDVEEDPETHRVRRIVGRHERVGCISEKTQEKMIKSGIKREHFEFLTKPPKDGEEEIYEL